MDVARHKPLAMTSQESDILSQMLWQAGCKLIEYGDNPTALGCFAAVEKVKPWSDGAAHNMGVCLAALGQQEAARTKYLHAWARAQNPRYAVAAAECARRLRKIGEAVELVTTAKAHIDLIKKHEKFDSMTPEQFADLSKSELNCHTVMGCVHHDRSEFDLAEGEFRKALEIGPGDKQAGLSLTLLKMAQGMWRESWRSYAHFLTYNQNSKVRSLREEDEWDGAHMEGKTLLVICDQGIGDTIQMLPHLVQYLDARCEACNIILSVQPQLVELMQHWYHKSFWKIVPFGQPLGTGFDHHATLLGMMGTFELDQEKIRLGRRVMEAPPAFASKWFKQIMGDSPERRLRVGLCWAGDPRHGNDHNRSMKFETMARVVEECPEIEFYTLQVGEALNQCRDDAAFKNLHAISKDFESFADTAGAVANLDAVVSVDTSVAHLAGTMGKTVAVLLPRPAEWRWELEGARTPWYQDAKLYRASKEDAWTTPIHDVIFDLKDLVTK